MGGSIGGSSNEAENQSSFNQDIWQPQGQALQQLYSSMGNLFGQTNQGMQQQIPGAVNQMQGVASQANPYWNQQMQGGAYRDMGLQNSLMGSLNQSLGQPTAMQDINRMIMGGEGNDYVDAMKTQMSDDMQYERGQDLAQNDLRANMYGQGGSSRHGITESDIYKQSGDRLAREQTNLGYNTFDTDLNRKMQIADQADQGTLQRQQMMSGMIGGQQQAMQGGLDYGQNMQGLNMGQFSPYMAPWQAAGQYSNNIGRPTVLGSGQGSGSSSGWGFGTSGGIGGGK